MRIVISISGYAIQEFIQRAIPKLPTPTEFVLLYVIDTRSAEEMNYVRKVHLFGSHSGMGRSLEMDNAEREIAAEVLNEASALLQSFNVPIEQVILRGRPEREITGYIDDHPADLLVIGSRYSQQAQNHPEPPPPPKPKHPDDLPPPKYKSGRGPQSIGPVARFVIDHVGCDLLLIA